MSLRTSFDIIVEGERDFSLYYPVRELFKRINLPEPLRIEYEKTHDKFNHEKITKISEYMAKSLASKKCENISLCVNKIGFFCGMVHEPQIEYFLKSDFGERDVYPSNLSFYKYEK